MDYASIIRDAWSTTWHYRFLWLLGLFTGAAAGTWSNFGAPGGSPMQYRATPTETQLPFGMPAVEQGAADVGAWITTHPMEIAAIVGGFLVVAFALLVVSFVAQGGMVEATVDIARHQPITAGRAWRAGFHLFWRYVGLTLLTIALGIGVALVLAALVALAIATSVGATGATQSVAIGVWVVLGLIAVIALIVLAVVATVVIAFAQRSVVVDDVGPLAAIQSAWQLFRTHLADSALIWLVNLALGIAAGIGVVVAELGLAVVLVAIGAVLWLAFGLTTPLFVYGAVAVGAAVVGLVVLGAIENTFFWSYWTLAYLRLRGAVPPTSPAQS